MLKMNLLWRLPTGLVLFGLVASCAAADVPNFFTWPPPSNGTTRTDGGNLQDNVDFTWSASEILKFTTNYTSYTVDLYQHVQDTTPDKRHKFIKTIDNHVIDNPDYQTDTVPTGNTTVSWSVSTYDAETQKDGHVFFFWIQNADDKTQEQFFMSHYFNITAGNDDDSSTPTSSSASSDQTTSLSTASSLSTAPSLSTASGSAANGTTGGSLDTSLNNNDFKPVLRLALGLSLGIGIPIFLVLAWLAWRVCRGRNKTDASRSGDSFREPFNRERASVSPTSDTREDAGRFNTSGELYEVPDHAVCEAPSPLEKEEVHEVPDHAVVEAPGDLLKDVEALVKVETAVELPSSKRFSFE